MKGRKLTFLAVVVSLILTGSCASAEVPDSCKQVFDERLIGLAYDSMTAERMQTLVTSEWGARGSELTTEGEVLHWRRGGTRYDAMLSRKGSRFVYVWWTSGAPAVNDLFRCAGKPAKYRARHLLEPDGRAVSIEFWYPSQGVVARVYVDALSRQRNGVVDESSAIRALVYTGARTVEDIAAIVPVEDPPEVRNKLPQLLADWPGSVQKMEISGQPSQWNA